MLALRKITDATVARDAEITRTAIARACAARCGSTSVSDIVGEFIMILAFDRSCHGRRVVR